ncbi:MAG: AAA family ATPase [Actinomycetota bacterium]|nr:AAA family ATPase [Actinomycetota bacterium]
MSRIVLATPDARFHRRVRLVFGGALNGDLRQLPEHLVLQDPAQLVSRINEAAGGAPEVVVVGPGLEVGAALTLARRIDQERPEISVVLVADPTPELWSQALRAGVRAVLSPEAPDAELREVFERASQTAARRRANLVPGGEEGGQLGRVITVASPKGGSGKTTIATNLAVGLAAVHPGQVVLVDADLQFGDVASALQLVPEHTIAEAARALGGLDAMGLKVFLTSHPSELWALCAPESPAEGELIGGEQLGQILRLLAAEFRYVVVDTSAGLSEQTLSALESSTDLVVICSMDVPSVRSLKKELDSLNELGMTTQRRLFVLNRADARVGMEARDIEATLGLTVNVAVPSSRLVPLSINQGVPVVQSDPRSAVARALQQLAGCFVEHPAPPAGGRFRRRTPR